MRRNKPQSFRTDIANTVAAGVFLASRHTGLALRARIQPRIADDIDGVLRLLTR